MMIVDEPPGPSLDMVRGRVDAVLRETLVAARARAIAVMDSPRYSDLLERVDALVTETPWTNRAQRSPQAVFPPLLRRERKRLLRDIIAAEQAAGHRERPELLHEVRKSAKRARYAVEVVQPVYRRAVTPFLQAVTHLQAVLGDLNDSVVTQRGLEQLAAQAHLNGESAFTYGRLHAREQEHATHTEEKYAVARKSAANKKLRVA